MCEAKNIKPVKAEDWVPFRCQLCGACCRDVEDSLMLEPMDIYRLGRFLREQGEGIDDPEDVLATYTHTSLLAERLPIFLLNTVGPEQACVFLKDGRCRVYEARPRVCRLYPFCVAPGDRGRDFLYCLSQDRSHHFTDGRVSVKDWFYQNFSAEARQFLKADFDALPILGRTVKEMGAARFKGMLFQFLFYRYYNYDFDQPFLPQFIRNTEELKKLAAKEAEGGQSPCTR